MSSATCDTNKGVVAPREVEVPSAQRGVQGNEFETTLSRIMQSVGVRTQAELGETFGIRQSSISDAKRRSSIPDSWLIKLVTDHSLNPIWVLRGTGAKYLVPQDQAPLPPCFENTLLNVPASMLLRILACRMNRPDITVTEGGAA